MEGSGWAGRWGGAACAVAGCTPMLFALITGAAGVTSAQAMAMPAMAPGWVTALGTVSWPLLLVSVALLVWSFWRTSALPRTVAYIATAGLVINQLHMTPWIFGPSMLLLLVAFAVSVRGVRRAA